jgi:hypothetical protein
MTQDSGLVLSLTGMRSSMTIIAGHASSTLAEQPVDKTLL